MSGKANRDKDNERINELYGMIEPARNEHIAREALEIAAKWLGKAERQARTLVELQNVRPVRCKDCLFYAGKQYGEYGRCDRNHTWMRTDSYCSEGVRRNG